MNGGLLRLHSAPLDLQVASLQSGMRNRIVNGDMRIDQQRAGAGVNVNVAGPIRSLDKWTGYGTAAAGSFGMTQLSAIPPPGYTNYLRMNCNGVDAAPAAGSVYYIQQAIEGTYCQDLQFGIASNTKSVTVSFWVRCSLTGIFSGSLKNSAGNRSYPFQFTINAANTWEYKTITISADTAGAWLVTTGIGLILSFDMGSGANSRGAASAWNAANNTGVTGAERLVATNGAIFDLTGVQLEAGPTATAFEQRPFGDMLRLCQREFQKSFNIATAPASALGANTGEQKASATKAGAVVNYFPHVIFPATMRAAPIVTLYSPVVAGAQVYDFTAGALTGSTAQNISERGFQYYATGLAGTAVGNETGVHYTADARL